MQVSTSLIVAYIGGCDIPNKMKLRMVRWLGWNFSELFLASNGLSAMKIDVFRGAVNWTPDPQTRQVGTFCMMWIPAARTNRVINTVTDVPCEIERETYFTARQLAPPGFVFEPL
jgi:hypothetical protein